LAVTVGLQVCHEIDANQHDSRNAQNPRKNVLAHVALQESLDERTIPIPGTVRTQITEQRLVGIWSIEESFSLVWTGSSDALIRARERQRPEKKTRAAQAFVNCPSSSTDFSSRRRLAPHPPADFV
jgi:hypothetical protein